LAHHRVDRRRGVQDQSDPDPSGRTVSDADSRVTMRQLAQDQRGVSTIEFALILPMLVLLTVAFLDIARALNAEVMVGGASQDGAHYAILHPSAPPSEITDAARARTAPLNAS